MTQIAALDPPFNSHEGRHLLYDGWSIEYASDGTPSWAPPQASPFRYTCLLCKGPISDDSTLSYKVLDVMAEAHAVEGHSISPRDLALSRSYMLMDGGDPSFLRRLPTGLVWLAIDYI